MIRSILHYEGSSEYTDTVPLPIDVVIPHKPSREWLFKKYTLPSIEAQDPSRIIILDDSGGAGDKRNRGVAMCTSPYVFIPDDDLIISGGYLKRAIEALETNPLPISYIYSDWIQVPLEGCMDPPITQAQYVVIPEFKDIALHDRGGVDWPVVRRETYQPFDVKVKRYQTWDWSLIMKKAGYEGMKIPGWNAVSFMIDRGITTGTGLEVSAEMRTYIQRKHGFIP